MAAQATSGRAARLRVPQERGRGRGSARAARSNRVPASSPARARAPTLCDGGLELVVAGDVDDVVVPERRRLRQQRGLHLGQQALDVRHERGGLHGHTDLLALLACGAGVRWAARGGREAGVWAGGFLSGRRARLACVGDCKGATGMRRWWGSGHEARARCCGAARRARQRRAPLTGHVPAGGDAGALLHVPGADLHAHRHLGRGQG